MKQTIIRTFEKLDLNPIILHEQPNGGKTIIEKFLDYSDVCFAIVLLSPDDLAYPKDKPSKEARLRTRQNVIFELGFFIDKLGRQHVVSFFRMSITLICQQIMHAQYGFHVIKMENGNFFLLENLKIVISMVMQIN